MGIVLSMSAQRPNPMAAIIPHIVRASHPHHLTSMARVSRSNFTAAHGYSVIRNNTVPGLPDGDLRLGQPLGWAPPFTNLRVAVANEIRAVVSKGGQLALGVLASWDSTEAAGDNDPSGWSERS
jgi:hypothetical protein